MKLRPLSDPVNRPSQAWLRAIFESPPRRDVNRECKSTTRYPHFAHCIGQLLYAEGGNENAAMLLFEQLWREGYVFRYKSQPFSLDEIGGPAKRTPDFLVELFDGRVYVVQVKAQRFCTDPIKTILDIDRVFLEDRGFRHLLWTDKSVLTSALKTNMLRLDLGARHPPERQVLDDIQQLAPRSKTLGDLLPKSDWESVMAAIALQKIFVSHLESYDEKTPFTLASSFVEAELLFRTGSAIFQQRRTLRPALVEKWGAAIEV